MADTYCNNFQLDEKGQVVSGDSAKQKQCEAIDALYTTACAMGLLADSLDGEEEYGLAHILRHLMKDVSNAAETFDG